MAARKLKRSIPDRLFIIINHLFLVFLGVICLLPFIHVVALSFSHTSMATAGKVKFWPQMFTVAPYEFLFSRAEFMTSFWVTIRRVILGLSLDLLIMITMAYPLSRSKRQLPGRTIFSWMLIITMFVNGGLIPNYLLIVNLGLKNKIWALVLPGAVQAFNIAVLLNFFRNIPKELEEAAIIDGAGQQRILWRIFVPLSIPALATLVVFQATGHWNEWFSGMIYMTDSANYPLSTYMRTILVNPSISVIGLLPHELEMALQISSRTFQSAAIVVGTIPILCVYPFLQRYFVKGMTLGGLKG